MIRPGSAIKRKQKPIVQQQQQKSVGFPTSIILTNL